MSAQDVVTNLRELASLTSTADGAQRLAWGPVWREARQWFNGKLADARHHAGDRCGRQQLGDAEGRIGSHGHHRQPSRLGAERRLARRRARRDGGPRSAARCSQGQPPPVTLKVVDWADEEGARFGRSLLGSSAAAGSLQVSRSRTPRRTRPASGSIDALRENGVELSRMHESQTIPEGDRRQGLPRAAHRTRPGARVDEQVDRRRARHVRRRAPPAAIRRPGRALGIHADPDAARCVPRRRGERARLPRDRPQAHHADRAGGLHGRHGESRAGHRHGGAGRLRDLARSARARCRRSWRRCWPTPERSSSRAARDNNVTVEWKRIWSIEPRPFDPTLDRAVRRTRCAK